MSEAKVPEFSKGIHDYYGRYADNADGKIKGLFTINLAVAGLLLGSLPSDCTGRTFAWIAVGLNALAGAFLMDGIYPRVSGPGASIVFWEHVRSKPSAESYADEVSSIQQEDIERAYAENNYYVADVLHRKFWAIRVAMWITIAALVFSVARVIAG